MATKTTKKKAKSATAKKAGGLLPQKLVAADDNDAPIEALQQAIRDLHGAASTFVEAVEVQEVFQGKVVWKGAVKVFDLIDHPTATRAYAWSWLTDEGRRRFVAILHVDPVNTPLRAVQAYILHGRWKPGQPTS